MRSSSTQTCVGCSAGLQIRVGLSVFQAKSSSCFKEVKRNINLCSKQKWKRSSGVRICGGEWTHKLVMRFLSPGWPHVQTPSLMMHIHPTIGKYWLSFRSRGTCSRNLMSALLYIHYCTVMYKCKYYLFLNHLPHQCLHFKPLLKASVSSLFTFISMIKATHFGLSNLLQIPINIDFFSLWK